MYHHHTSTRLEDQCQQSEPTTCYAILISHFRSLLALVRGGASSVSPITGRPQTWPKASRERESTRTALPEQLFAIHPCWLPRSDCLYNMRLLCLLRRGGRGRLPRRPLLDQQPLLYTPRYYHRACCWCWCFSTFAGVSATTRSTVASNF